MVPSSEYLKKNQQRRNRVLCWWPVSRTFGVRFGVRVEGTSRGWVASTLGYVAVGLGLRPASHPAITNSATPTW